MDNQYLWDRSGEPDPEIQQLEDLMGTLRYQPQPLKIPADFQIARRRSFYPPLAIAASLLFFALAIGLWINFSRRHPSVANNAPAAPQPAIGTQKTNDTNTPLERRAENKPTAPKQSAVAPRLVLASYQPRPRRAQPPPTFTAEELALKEQVLFALRLASNKLNVAQRSIQGPPPQNMIRNQHKIG